MQVDDFIDLLFDLMSNLRPHHFIAKDQTKYFIESRENLQPSEVIVSGDFSENYNFIIQNCSQSFHWNNGGCTVHPWQVYYRIEGKEGVFHTSYAWQ